MIGPTRNKKQNISIDPSITNNTEWHNNIFQKIASKATKRLPIFTLSSSSSSPSLSHSNVRTTLLPRIGRLHRRNRTCSTVLLLRLNGSKSESFTKKNTNEDRSTMSLCSLTSDEYEFDDMTDSFEDIINVVPNPSTSSAHNQEVCHYNTNNISKPLPVLISRSFDSVSSTNKKTLSHEVPQTPITVSLQMRPSHLNLLRSMDDTETYYYGYDGDDEKDYMTEDMPYCTWNQNSNNHSNYISSTSRGSVIPTVESFETIHDVSSDYPMSDPCNKSFYIDDDDEEEDIDNEYNPTSPSPRTPPRVSSSNKTIHTNDKHHHMLSPPILRLKPKHVVYLPIIEYNNSNEWDPTSDFMISNNTSFVSTSSSSASTRKYSNSNLQHLLMPDDF